MADATALPTLKHFRWSRSGAARPELAAPITATGTTLTFTTAPKDKAGVVITAHFLLGIKRLTGSDRGFVEIIYVPAAGLSADGLTATACIRGIDPSGIDFDTTDTSFAIAHEAGEPVFCAVAAVEGELITSTLQGVIATGGVDLKVGLETDVDITLYAENADANAPFLRYSASANEWQFSNDGTSTATIGTAAGSITGGDGITVTAGDVDVDLTDTIIFVQTSSGAGDSGKVVRMEADGFMDLDFLGTTATLTAANLDTLIDGSNADSLHVHTADTLSFTSAEALTADDAVALLPYEVEYFSQLTEVNLAFGDANAQRRFAIKIIPKVTSSTLTTMQFRAAEAVGASTALGNLTISIQTDSSSEPSGTAITNGTANVITQATQQGWTTTMASRTATWASSPTLTAGTTYWIVFEVAGTDATNFLNLGDNSTYDENYITFTRLTYDLDSATWGSSVTNATPFFWFNTQVKLLGMGLVQTDANFGGRTWSFVGFVKTTVAAEASTDIYFTRVADLASLVPNTDYWLSTTAGAITATQPNGLYGNDFAYKVGRAVTTTDLLVEKGPKRIRVNSAAVSATTTTQYILWFKAATINAYAVNGDGGNYWGTSSGFYDGTANINTHRSRGASTNTHANTTGSVVFISDPTGGDDATSVISTVTDIGFQFVTTETGVITLYYTLECLA